MLKLLDALIFNLIAGNADAHSKNFSILYEDQGARLTLLYDLLATFAYPELSPKLAMKIGKRVTLAEMDAQGWSAFATDAGLGLLLIRRRVAKLSESAQALRIMLLAGLYDRVSMPPHFCDLPNSPGIVQRDAR